MSHPVSSIIEHCAYSICSIIEVVNTTSRTVPVDIQKPMACTAKNRHSKKQNAAKSGGICGRLFRPSLLDSVNNSTNYSGEYAGIGALLSFIAGSTLAVVPSA